MFPLQRHLSSGGWTVSPFATAVPKNGIQSVPNPRIKQCKGSIGFGKTAPNLHHIVQHSIKETQLLLGGQIYYILAYKNKTMYV